LEAFVFNILFSVSFNIILQEIKSGLISIDRIVQVIFIDNLVVVSQERSNCFDARCTLKILTVYHLFKILLKITSSLMVAQSELSNDSHQCFLETFKVPILINNLMNYSCLENLVGFVSEQEHKIVHKIDFLGICHVLFAPLWQNLLT